MPTTSQHRSERKPEPAGVAQVGDGPAGRGQSSETDVSSWPKQAEERERSYETCFRRLSRPIRRSIKVSTRCMRARSSYDSCMSPNTIQLLLDPTPQSSPPPVRVTLITSRRTPVTSTSIGTALPSATSPVVTLRPSTSSSKFAAASLLASSRSPAVATTRAYLLPRSKPTLVVMSHPENFPESA